MVAKKNKSKVFFGNRLREVIGIVFVFIALFCAISFLTYNPYDPSFNLATNAEIKNLSGSIGAYISAPIIGFIGFGAIIFAIVPLAWGIKIFLKKEMSHIIMNSTFFIILIPLSAMFFTMFDEYVATPEHWSESKSGLGGFIGNYITSNITDFVTSYVSKYVYIAVVSVLFISFLFASMGIKFSNWFIIFSYSFKAIGWIINGMFILFAKISDMISVLLEKADSNNNVETDGDIPSSSDVELSNSNIKNSKKPAKKNADKRKIVRMAADKKKSNNDGPVQATMDLNIIDGYQMPSIDLLQKPKKVKASYSESSLANNAELLEKVLNDYGINGKIIEVRPGPVVTLYELEPSAGTKSARVIGLADDIARSMSASSARIAVVPGKNAIGIELPNADRETVYLREMIGSKEFEKTDLFLPLALGKDIGGEPQLVDLAKTPHMLVAGTTGSGKSVGINTMILSLLYKYTPEECKFIMVDPKMLELSVYADIPHLITPVVTEPSKAVVALKWTVREMENRYKMMSNLGVRNIYGYNDKIKQAKEKGEELTRTVQTGFDRDTGKPIIESVPMDLNTLPFIVVIVDEMADLMMVGGKEIEMSVQRLAQMARAAGIHVILATQRPSVDVITGIIKANFPTRISFQVSSKIDSRTIIGESGAEQLLGMGDMLYLGTGNRLLRVHGPFVADDEVERVVTFLKKQAKPSYVEEVLVDEEDDSSINSVDEERDELYDKAVEIVVNEKKASTSYIQRSLKIGYNRAANIIEQMERNGVISKADHVGRREVLIEY